MFRGWWRRTEKALGSNSTNGVVGTSKKVKSKRKLDKKNRKQGRAKRR